jgi:uncharacterized protein YecA (UPF0149 family)
MPTIIQHRTWCATCKEWTLHADWGDNPCLICKTKRDSYNLADIPDEKIQEQRKRYSDSHSPFNYLSELINPKSQYQQLAEMFSSEFPKEIIEDDAGQKEIDEERRKIRHEEIIQEEIEYKAKVAEYQKFKNLRRNDICACGSGVKYKKCCMQKYE